MKNVKLNILKLASREIGMLTDHRRWPPSDRGEVKHLLRKGYLIKKRTGSPSCRRSMVHATEKGLDYLKNNA